MGIKRASDNLRSQRTRDGELNAAEEQKESSKIVNFLSSQFSTLTASHNGKIYRQANDMAEETAQNFCCHVSSSPFSPVLFWSDQTRRRLQLQLQPLLPYFRSLALDFYSISAVAPRLQLNKLESSPPD